VENDFQSNIEWFVKNIESRKRLLPTFAHIASRLFSDIDKDLDKFVENHGYEKVYDEDGGLEQFGVPLEYAGRYNTLERAYQHTMIFADLLPRMTLVSLVSLFDAYLARLIRTLFTVKPEILNGSEKNIKFSDLMDYDSLDDAQEHIVSQEIESILRDSHTEQFKWLESKLGIPLRDLDAWKVFIEVTERRNLFVHSDGIVNKQYLSVCKSNGYQLGENLNIGDRLDVPPDYYKTACDCIAEIGVKLAQVTWRKMIPEEEGNADDSLISVTYGFLLSRDYELASTLCKLCDIPAINNSTIEHTYYLKLNQAIALKGLDEDKKMSSLLESVEWSVLAEKFQLAVAVLKEDWAVASQLMVKIGDKGDINRHYYHEWPLFRWFRRTEEFKEAYENVFGEEYKIIGKAKDSEEDHMETEQEDPNNSSKEDTSGTDASV
jgi:hypothetical protein